ncbi:MAG TPA: hypothetical protein VLI54_01525 [Bacillota bacterium]|nr:hypothetical protein [Bacillota bacterium]
MGRYFQRFLAFLNRFSNDIRMTALYGSVAIVFLIISIVLFYHPHNDVIGLEPQVAGAQTTKGQIGTAAATTQPNSAVVSADTTTTNNTSPAAVSNAEPAVIDPSRLVPSEPQQHSPNMVPIGFFAPIGITLHAGEVSANYDIHTTDGSSVTWQLANGASYWGSITPEKTGAPAFVVIDQPESENVTSALHFHIEVQPTLLPGEYTHYEYAVHVTDPARSYDQYVYITFDLAL